jgi:cell division protein FtsA
MPGIDLLAEDVLQLPARVGRPRQLAGLSDILHDPAYATSVGLLRWALKEQEIMFRSSPSPVPALGGVFKKVAHLMRVILPQ